MRNMGKRTRRLLNISRGRVVGTWVKNIAENYREIEEYGYVNVLDDLVNMLVEEGLIRPEDKSRMWNKLDKYLCQEYEYENPDVLRQVVIRALEDEPQCFYDDRGDLICFASK